MCPSIMNWLASLKDSYIPQKGGEHRQRVSFAQRRLVAVAVVADGDQQLEAHALDRVARVVAQLEQRKQRALVQHGRLQIGGRGRGQRHCGVQEWVRCRKTMERENMRAKLVRCRGTMR
jgi:hypothetical protein